MIWTGTKHTLNRRMNLSRGHPRRDFTGICSAETWQVNRIAHLLPDLRIILTLRHPIERVWSQALLESGYVKEETSAKLVQLAFAPDRAGSQ